MGSSTPDPISSAKSLSTDARQPQPGCGSAASTFYRPSLIEVEDLNAPIIQQEIAGRHIRDLRRRDRRNPPS
jgi:hypothetical protein